MAEEMTYIKEEDEVLVKQPDGTFKLMKLAEIPAGPILPQPTPAASAIPFLAPARQLYDKEAEEVIKASGLAIAPDLHVRLKDTIVSIISEARTRTQTLDRLQLAKEKGGVALSKVQADNILKFIDKKRTEILAAATPPVAPVAAAKGPLPELELPETPAPPPPSAARAPLPAKPSLPSAPRPTVIFVPAIERYDKVAEKIARESGVAVPTKLQQRFKVIIISRLKDVRKKHEALEKLQMSVDRGGLGLGAAEADKVLKLVDKERTTVILNEVKNPGAKSLTQRPFANAQGDKTTDPATNLTVPEITAPPRVKEIQSSEAAHPAPARPSPPHAVTASEAKQSREVSGIATPPSSAARNDKSISPPPTPPPPPAAPTPPPPPYKPPLTVAIPQTSSGKSKVEDIAYKPRLVGPLEELQGLTLVDFRRLSPNPSVAADKIYGKIELLAQQSFDEKVKGIRAWQASEVNRLYLEVLNESLSKAAPVSQVIKDKKEGLSEVEWQAVMELNRRLRL